MQRLLLAKHQGFGDAQFWVLVNTLGTSLFWAAFCWAAYVAVEPYARRAWPDRIVSWTRLLAGRFRDPLIGRDILVGLLVSVLTILLNRSIVLVAQSFGLVWLGDTSFRVPDACLSMRHGLAVVLLCVGSVGVVTALWVLFLLVAILAVARSRRIARPIFVLVLFLSGCASFSQADPILAVVIACTLAAYLSISMLRFGLLTLATAITSNVVYVHFPLTLDFSVWYAGNVWFAASILVALAFYGFFTATKGQAFLKDEVFEPRSPGG